jgi:hypothetical protein
MATQTETPVRRGFACACTCGEHLDVCVEDMTVKCREGCGFEKSPAELRRMAHDFLALAGWLDSAPVIEE